MPWPEVPAPGIAVFTRLDPDVQALGPALESFGLQHIEPL
jgi:glutamate racemase